MLGVDTKPMSCPFTHEFRSLQPENLKPSGQDASPPGMVLPTDASTCRVEVDALFVSPTGPRVVRGMHNAFLALWWKVEDLGDRSKECKRRRSITSWATPWKDTSAGLVGSEG